MCLAGNLRSRFRPPHAAEYRALGS
jgi:hypothetical protein